MAGTKRGGGGGGGREKSANAGKRQGSACYILGYLIDSNAVAHSVGTDNSWAVIHLLARDNV